MKRRLFTLLYTPVLAATLFLTSCESIYVVHHTQSENNQVDSTTLKNTSTEAYIAKYRNELEGKMNIQLNSTEKTMDVGVPEGLLGNFVCDLTYPIASSYFIIGENIQRCDFALLNNGGLRMPLEKGDITIGDVYGVMPFENEIVLVEISADKMMELLEYVAKKSLGTGRKMGVPVSKQLRVTIKEDPTPFVHSVTIQKQPVSFQRSYFVVTSDYLANGGDKMTFFNDPINRYSTGLKLRDAIMDHLGTQMLLNKTIDVELDNRITIISE